MVNNLLSLLPVQIDNYNQTPKIMITSPPTPTHPPASPPSHSTPNQPSKVINQGYSAAKIMTIIPNIIVLLRQMEIKQDPYRYINWLLYFLAAIVNSIPTQLFAGVSPIAKRVYEISQFQVNMVGLFYPMSYILLLIPANYVIDKKGLKLGTLICEFCAILGLLLRLLVRVHFYFIYLGNFVCSLGFCFMISGANKFANIWFPHHQIFLVSSTCVFALFASDAVGVVISTFTIRQDATKDDIFSLMMWQCVAIIPIQLAMAFFFRATPKHIQNYASAAARNPFKSDLLSLLHNKNYIILFLGITFFFGDFSLLFVFLPWITKTYNYESVSNGIIIICANLVGCLGCLLAGIFGDRFAYRTKSLILAPGIFISLALLWVSLEINSPVMSYICGGLAGLFAYPLLTTITDFATQTTFPVGEATASGILIFGGQIAGVLLAVIFSFIFDGESLELTRILNGILVGMALAGFIVLLFSKEILKREEYENNKQRESLLEKESGQLTAEQP